MTLTLLLRLESKKTTMNFCFQMGIFLVLPMASKLVAGLDKWPAKVSEVPMRAEERDGFVDLYFNNLTFKTKGLELQLDTMCKCSSACLSWGCTGRSYQVKAPAGDALCYLTKEEAVLTDFQEAEDVLTIFQIAVAGGPAFNFTHSIYWWYDPVRTEVYFLNEETKNKYFQAVDHCAKMNLDLAIIDSLHQFEFLHKIGFTRGWLVIPINPAVTPSKDFYTLAELKAILQMPSNEKKDRIEGVFRFGPQDFSVGTSHTSSFVVPCMVKLTKG